MLEKLKNIRYQSVKRIQIVEVQFTSAGSVYHILQFKKTGNDIQLVELKEKVDFEAVKGISKNTPLLLAFSGKGIISKKVGSKGNYIKDIIFSASVDDFFIYELQQEFHNYVSVARKDLILSEFEQFQEEGFQVLDYSIGPFVGIHLEQILNTNKLLVRDYHLSFQENTLENFVKSTENEELEIGDTRINS
ncbi:MAG: hypothetical protein HRT68_10455, partial [Flavobacteriaceae bacterium]|nr:hypothetical protein [Flavobacteriaceae bacterium]